MLGGLGKIRAVEPLFADATPSPRRRCCVHPNHEDTTMRRQSSQWGFSLIETLATIAVIAILAGTALPSLSKMKNRSAVAASHNLLTTGFNTARSLALFENHSTTICPGTPETGCRRDGQWHHGWIVFSDLNGDGRFGADETLLRSEDAFGHGMALLGSANRSVVRFRTDGSAGGSNLTIRFCTGGGAPKAALIMSNTGRSRSAGSGELARMEACPD